MDEVRSYVGASFNEQSVYPGDAVLVNLGMGDRKGTYVGKEGSNCSDTRVVHVRDDKSGKVMVVPFQNVRLA